MQPVVVLQHRDGELLGFALLAQAPAGGAVAMLGFGALLAARIRVEERALDLRSR